MKADNLSVSGGAGGCLKCYGSPCSVSTILTNATVERNFASLDFSQASRYSVGGAGVFCSIF